MKNNLCADTTRRTQVDFRVFGELDALLGKRHLRGSQLPRDRAVFHDLYTTVDGKRLGEGSVVSLIGFVAKVQCGGSETVNCNRTMPADSDLQVMLVPNRRLTECSGVVAEVIPHLRPAMWDAARISTPSNPMRFTGQMFVDIRQRPCDAGMAAPGSTARSSSWEMHPVYAIDVCKNSTLAACSNDDDSVWTTLASWQVQTED